jgi:gliding motility-associated-like protein
MKLTYTRPTLLAILAALSSGLAAQSTYDLRLALKDVDCKSGNLAVRMEVKATKADQPFKMGDANYRFDYPSLQVASPKILSQDNFSSQAADRNYGAHNLQGSRELDKEGIVSLNTFYTGNNAGAKLVVGEWTPIATLGFELKDYRQPIELKWHTDKTFPITGMSQVYVTEPDPTQFEFELRDLRSSGAFSNLVVNPAALCPSKSPVVAATPVKTRMNKAIDVTYPIFDADENDQHTVRVIAVGKGQVTPSVKDKFLSLNYMPAADYVGKDEVVLELGDKFGNVEKITIPVTVSPDALIFHNGISPNDDGLNDVFVIEGLDKFTSTKLSIFDQSGRELYANSNYKNTWNAQFEGKPLPNGTYYYVLEAGKTETYTGYIQVAR